LRVEEELLMHNVFQIFKRDLNSLIHNFWALVVILFMLILPAMYAWVNIYANWDPYGNTGNIQIAVVSEDQDYITEDGTIVNVGDQVIENLKQNDDIDWQFLDSKEEALDGVYEGTYYAAIDFDEHMTYNMYNFLTTGMDRPVIRYYVNNKKNAIAVKITDTAAETVKTQVEEAYLKVIIETGFSGIKDAVDASSEEDPVEVAEDLLTKVNNNLISYNNALEEFKSAGDSLSNTLANLDATVDYAIYALERGSNNLNNASDRLGSAYEQIQELRQSVANLLTDVQNSFQEMITILQSDSSPTSLQDRIQGAITALQSLREQILTGPASATRDAVVQQIDSLISQLQSFLPSNTITTSALNSAVSNFSNSLIPATAAYLNDAESSVIAENTESTQEDGTSTAASDNATSSTTSSDSTSTSSAASEGTTVSDVSTMSMFYLDSANQALSDASANLEEAANATSEESKDEAIAKAQERATYAANSVNSLTNSLVSTANTSGATEESATLQDVASRVSDAASVVNRQVIDISQAQDAIASAQSSLNSSGYPAVEGIISDMQSLMSDYSNMMSAWANALGDSRAVIASINDFVQALNSSFSQIQTVITDVSNQITDLLDTLDGLKNNEQLNTLLSFFGLDPDSLSSFLASPVDTVTEAVYPVDTYGAGMAPFYSSLGIWVGSVILCAVISCVADPTGLDKPKDWQMYLGRYLTFLVLAELQSLFILLGDVFILGVQCLHLGLFLIAGLVTGFSFSLLVYSLTIAFGDVGKAIVVVVMILQIAGSSGTFPIDILPVFFQKVYKFFPFPYAINAFRECIAGLYQNDYIKYLLQLNIFAAFGLFIGLVVRKPFIGLNEYFEDKIDENQMMAK
jgi:putative membrane protein